MVKPHVGFNIILRNTLVITVPSPQVQPGWSLTLLSSFSEPFNGLIEIIREKLPEENNFINLAFNLLFG